MTEQDRLEAFRQHRSLLFAVAYRMLGSSADAEDMLQETFVRWQQTADVAIESPRALLVTILPRLCINHMQSARVKREEYFGQWLPEPLVEAMKTVVITGANVGIGFATARFLAAIPEWHVVLACRNESKASAAIRDIKATDPYAHLSFVPLDLFSLASVRRLPAALASMEIPPIGALILNAGGVNMKAKSLEFTEDRFERTFQLNFLGHFLLANLLIKQMTPARIVFVSSDLHDPAATRMGKIMPPKYGPVEDLARGIATAARLQPMARYGTAKMYAMMAAHELDRRLRQTGRPITVNSWSPGVVPTTQGQRVPVRVRVQLMPQKDLRLVRLSIGHGGGQWAARLAQLTSGRIHVT